MGIPKNLVPERMRRLMAREDRQPLALPTQPEADAKWAKGKEKELQENIENLLRQRGLFFMRVPMHKKTGIRLGWPDFTIVLPPHVNYEISRDLPRLLMVEVKVKGGQVDPDQVLLHDAFRQQTRTPVYVVWSFNDFVTLLNEHCPVI